ncbi:oligosaccharide flippase family protein, partial [Methylocystis suflitae]|uniref:oligosaccharide flippase family protein n=1 Tax=Methylocystis suflitae TaxID=2951405 RepID=UPI0021087598
MSIRKHTAYNLVGALLPMGVSLLTIPIYIRLVGDARFGVLAVLWSFLGYFGLFDLGLGRATAQRIAALGDSSSERIASTFWTALAMNAALGLVGGILIWPTSKFFFEHVMSMGADLRSELVSGLPWLTLAVPLMTISGVLGGALQGRAQFLEMNIISISGSVLIQILPLTVAWSWGPDLAWLIPSVILTSLLSAIVMFWRCKIHVFHDHAPSISGDQAKSLLLFGGWVTISSMVGPLMVVL